MLSFSAGTRPPGALITGLLMALSPVPAGAQTAEPEKALPDDIAREVDEAENEKLRRLFPTMERWQEARRRIRETAGLGWTASYHSVGLAAAGGDGVPAGASGDLTAQGVWVPGEKRFENPTELRFRLRHRHAYGAHAASEVGREIGALWGPVDGFSDSGFEIPDFYLRHEFERARVDLRYGQMAIDSQFGGHQFSSSKKFFLNQAFAANPAVAFPRFGAGLTLEKAFGNGLKIGAGSTTVQGTQAGEQVDFKFNSGDLFQILQFSYDFKNPDGLAQRVVLFGWHSDSVDEASQPEGEGVQFIYERALDEEGTRLFSTCSWSSGGAAPLDAFVNIGLGLPWNDHDFVGAAAGLGLGSGPGGPVQSVFEGFYRWQPYENLQISPDVQLIIGEGLDGGPGVRLIAGLRLALTF